MGEKTVKIKVLQIFKVSALFSIRCDQACDQGVIVGQILKVSRKFSSFYHWFSHKFFLQFKHFSFNVSIYIFHFFHQLIDLIHMHRSQRHKTYKINFKA